MACSRYPVMDGMPRAAVGIYVREDIPMRAPGKPDVITARSATRCMAVVVVFGVSWG